MSKVDVHADDYGLTMQTSLDILQCVNAGKLDSISVVPNMEAYDSTLVMWQEKLKKEISPKISVHLNFMEGHCCCRDRELGLLTDEKGYFKISWIDLVRYNYDPFHYKEAKAQLKAEIRSQLWKVIKDYQLLEKGGLRVDSHQHTHMIPIVMRALLEVIQEDKITTEYIRISKETVAPYLKKVSFYKTYRPVNLVKVGILSFFSLEDEKRVKKQGLSGMLLCGVFLSGSMDEKRVKGLLPQLKKAAEKRGVTLELLFHPGSALKEETVREEFVSADANKFYLSDNRKVEYRAVMSLEK